MTADNDIVFVKPPELRSEAPPRESASAEEIRKLDEKVVDWLRRTRAPAEAAAPESGEPVEAILDALREQVVDRLAQRILERWETTRDRTLQDEVLDRLTKMLLDRWSAPRAG